MEIQTFESITVADRRDSNPVIFCPQSTQYYDMRWSCEHLIMVWINAFVMLMSQLLPPSYCDLLHRSAAHLGRWQKLEHGSYSNAPQHLWVALLVHMQVVARRGNNFVVWSSADGQKAQFGRKACWYDTADVYTRQLDLITWLCPLMSHTQGFTWVFHDPWLWHFTYDTARASLFWLSHLLYDVIAGVKDHSQ